MNRRPLVALIAAAPLVLAACTPPLMPGAGATTSEDRPVDGATGVALDGVGRVRLTVGEEAALTVTAGDRVLDRITTEVRDGVLVIGIDGPGWGNPGRIVYDVVLPEVDTLRVDGAGEIDADLSPAPALAVHLDGAGEITAHGVEVADLEVQVDGAGEITLTGSTAQQMVRLDGAGQYDGTDLRAEHGQVVIGGAGEAEVHVTGTLNAQVDGVGQILHSGGAEVTSQVSGIGRVRQH